MLAPSVIELRTPRLRLRRPIFDDLEFVHALHSAPHLSARARVAPHHPRDRSRRVLSDWLEHLRLRLLDLHRRRRDTDRLRRGKHAGLGDREVLNLYYRFLPEQHGSGLGCEAARAAVAFATEWVPGPDLTAVIRPVNQSSSGRRSRPV